jgi:hypothetical protein
MNTKLTLLERREIARKTIPTMRRDRRKNFRGWVLLIFMTHKEETYDYFGIPKFENEVDEFYKTHPIIRRFL